MKFRCFLPDWFEDLEAETEEEAQQKMAELVKEKIKKDDIIVWSVD